MADPTRRRHNSSPVRASSASTSPRLVVNSTRVAVDGGGGRHPAPRVGLPEPLPVSMSSAYARPSLVPTMARPSASTGGNSSSEPASNDQRRRKGGAMSSAGLARVRGRVVAPLGPGAGVSEPVGACSGSKPDVVPSTLPESNQPCDDAVAEDAHGDEGGGDDAGEADQECAYGVWSRYASIVRVPTR